MDRRKHLVNENWKDWQEEVRGAVLNNRQAPRRKVRGSSFSHEFDYDCFSKHNFPYLVRVRQFNKYIKFFEPKDNYIVKKVLLFSNFPWERDSSGKCV